MLRQRAYIAAKSVEVVVTAQVRHRRVQRINAAAACRRLPVGRLGVARSRQRRIAAVRTQSRYQRAPVWRRGLRFAHDPFHVDGAPLRVRVDSIASFCKAFTCAASAACSAAIPVACRAASEALAAVLK